jgi:RNA polymerase sporulation-specific sigma factor
LRDNSSLRVSRSLRDIAYKALQAKENLSKNSFKEPTIDEISKEIDMPAKSVIFALDAISDTLSLNDPCYNENGDAINLLDQIADTKNTDENIFENLSIQDAIKTLSDREREILLMRYYVGKTQTEVSEEIGISQAQVSRLEKNALKTIKEFLI